tara:strand:+ start:2589 stop:3116 length:528 start_codon:yes stop_codon:yes gene_type:complete
MIFTIAQINTIWQNKTATLDKIYLCDDNYMYKGVSNGALTRVLTGNLDNYKAELRKQQLAAEQEEYQQQLTVELLVNQVSELNTKSEIKQVEIDFGNEGLFEKEFTIYDSRILSDTLILASLAYSKPTDKDLDELEMDDLIIKAGVSSEERFNLFITAADGSPLEGKFKINYSIN